MTPFFTSKSGNGSAGRASNSKMPWMRVFSKSTAVQCEDAAGCAIGQIVPIKYMKVMDLYFLVVSDFMFPGCNVIVDPYENAVIRPVWKCDAFLSVA